MTARMLLLNYRIGSTSLLLVLFSVSLTCVVPTPLAFIELQMQKSRFTDYDLAMPQAWRLAQC
jgi:hypothetical protein